MAIINGTRSTKKEKIKLEINAEILEKITQYCAWADIDDVSYFFEEAACFVFSKDKDFKSHQKTIKRTNKTSIES